MTIAKILLTTLVTAAAVATAGSAQKPLGPTTSETAATLGQVFMGPLGSGSSAFTGILITNKDPNQESCDVGIIFHQGSAIGQQIPNINGQPTDIAADQIPRGGIRWFDLTSDQLIQGSVTVFVGAPCTKESVSVQGTYFIGDLENPQGGISESFTIRANDESTWLKDQRCLAISVKKGTREPSGIGQGLGIAISSVNPGQPAAAGTDLQTMIFGQDGEFIGEDFRQITGLHETFFPGDAFTEVEGKITFIFCLTSSDANYQADLSAVNVNTRGPQDVQFDAPIFADGFESGDTTSWSRQN